MPAAVSGGAWEFQSVAARFSAASLSETSWLPPGVAHRSLHADASSNEELRGAANEAGGQTPDSHK
jgi:hypothetical protein